MAARTCTVCTLRPSSLRSCLMHFSRARSASNLLTRGRGCAIRQFAACGNVRCFSADIAEKDNGLHNGGLAEDIDTSSQDLKPHRSGHPAPSFASPATQGSQDWAAEAEPSTSSSSNPKKWESYLQKHLQQQQFSRQSALNNEYDPYSVLDEEEPLQQPSGLTGIAANWDREPVQQATAEAALFEQEPAETQASPITNADRFSEQMVLARAAQGLAEYVEAAEREGRQLSNDELQDRSMYEVFRVHNTSLPDLKGQVIKCRVTKVDKRMVTFDTGFKTDAKFKKQQLKMSQVVTAEFTGQREHEKDFRVGDVMHFVVEEVETPYGDMYLQPVGASAEEVIQLRAATVPPFPLPQRSKLVWEELEEHMQEQTTVKGRVLNAINGGYAVGIAGVVCFLPFSMCTVATASQIGVLQEFRVYKMHPQTRNVVLTDARTRGGSFRGAVGRTTGVRPPAQRLTLSDALRKYGLTGNTDASSPGGPIGDPLTGSGTPAQYHTLRALTGTDCGSVERAYTTAAPGGVLDREAVVWNGSSADLTS